MRRLKPLKSALPLMGVPKEGMNDAMKSARRVPGRLLNVVAMQAGILLSSRPHTAQWWEAYDAIRKLLAGTTIPIFEPNADALTKTHTKLVTGRVKKAPNQTCVVIEATASGIATVNIQFAHGSSMVLEGIHVKEGDCHDVPFDMPMHTKIQSSKIVIHSLDGDLLAEGALVL
jgi:hypothetical protein